MARALERFYDYVSEVACARCATKIEKKMKTKKRPTHTRSSFAIGLVRIPGNTKGNPFFATTRMYGFCGFLLSFGVLLSESLPELTPES